MGIRYKRAGHPPVVRNRLLAQRKQALARLNRASQVFDAVPFAVPGERGWERWESARNETLSAAMRFMRIEERGKALR